MTRSEMRGDPQGVTKGTSSRAKGSMSRRTFMVGTVALAATPKSSLGIASGKLATRAMLFDAIARGDSAAVDRYLTACPSLLSELDNRGRSILSQALVSRRPSVCEVIIRHGFQPDLHEAAMMRDWARLDALASKHPESVNRVHPIGGTAMYAAASGGAGADLWRIYSHCALPNARPAGGFSPLRAALEFPDVRTAEMTAATLLANGADARAADPDGWTVLHAATMRGSVPIVETLIRKGAHVGAQTPDGQRAVDLADRIGLSDLATILEHHERIPRDDDSLRRSLDATGREYALPSFDGVSMSLRSDFVGASHRDMQRVREALARDARLVHSIATTNEAAIEAGAHMGNHDIIELLLDHGAPYATTTAVVRNDLETVRSRLRAHPGAIHERGAHDFPMLWYAVIGGEKLDMAELLLDAGANPEQQHFLGTTALHFAVLQEQRDMAVLLLEHGADPNRAGRKFSSDGQTPLQLARQRDNEAMVALLIDHGALQ